MRGGGEREERGEGWEVREKGIEGGERGLVKDRGGREGGREGGQRKGGIQVHTLGFHSFFLVPLLISLRALR